MVNDNKYILVDDGVLDKTKGLPTMEDLETLDQII